MCPEFNIETCICEIAGIEPCQVECVDEYCCYSTRFKTCRLYLLEKLMDCNQSILLMA
jgi:hypothetical protein